VIQTGGVVCAACMPPTAAIISYGVSNHLGALLAGEWEVVETADEQTRVSASAIVSAYSQWHIDRGLKSFNHLERT
jgi:DNA repair protein RecO (recombination protein O)